LQAVECEMRAQRLDDLDSPVLGKAEGRQHFLEGPPFSQRPDHGRRRGRRERRRHCDGRWCHGSAKKQERAPRQENDEKGRRTQQPPGPQPPSVRIDRFVAFGSTVLEHRSSQDGDVS
jgi:hypothetical protein